MSVRIPRQCFQRGKRFWDISIKRSEIQESSGTLADGEDTWSSMELGSIVAAAKLVETLIKEKLKAGYRSVPLTSR